MNIVELIERETVPGDTALWAAGRRMSYGELHKEVGRLAGGLRACRVWPAAGVPRVGLLGENSIEYVVAALAVMRAGGCVVPVPGELAAPEREELARSTALHMVILVGDGDWPGERCAGPFEPGLRVCPLEAAAPRFPVEEFEALGPAFVRFSSGTTGRSKGVVLSHTSLRDRIESANRALQIRRSDRVLWMLPMAHHFAVSIVLYLRFGATTVIETRAMAADVLATAEASAATVSYGTPFHHALLAADEGGFAWPSLRLAVSTAAALPAETAREFHRRFGRGLVQALGVIECGLPLINLKTPVENAESVGHPIDGWEVSVRNEAGEEAPNGEPGELWLRGPGMFDAYLDPWQPRAEATCDGWFGTGDLGRRDRDGAVWILGRRKSVINVGGLKVFPEEVEAVLDRNKAVLRSRVSGRAHPVFGFVPVAEVLAEEGEVPDPQELRAACREQLAPHKVPVTVTVVNRLAITESGKVKR